MLPSVYRRARIDLVQPQQVGMHRSALRSARFHLVLLLLAATLLSGVRQVAKVALEAPVRCQQQWESTLSGDRLTTVACHTAAMLVGQFQNAAIRKVSLGLAPLCRAQLPHAPLYHRMRLRELQLRLPPQIRPAVLPMRCSNLGFLVPVLAAFC